MSSFGFHPEVEEENESSSNGFGLMLISLLENLGRKRKIKPDENNTSGRKPKRKDYSRGAKRPKMADPWDCHWLQLISNPDVRDPSSRMGKEFRRKFRVPFPTFEMIVDMCKTSDETRNNPLFTYGSTDCCGQKSIPLELKILVALRVLGSGLTYSDVSELTNCVMSESECQRFCKAFYRLFSQSFGEKIIKPLTGMEKQRSMDVYKNIGLPGCIGSIDATFIKCDKLPESLANLATGEKGKGLLFNVIVDHCQRVLHVQRPVLATINDKISVQYNEFLQKLENKEIYSDENDAYEIRIGSGANDVLRLRTCYVIADGGYVSKPTLISAFSNCTETSPVKYKFSDWLASVRKDVECFFGILKQRFRYLRSPNNVHAVDQVSDAFVTCCILHNLILMHDGTSRLWEANVNWKELAPPDATEERNETLIGNIIETVSEQDEVVEQPASTGALRIEELVPDEELRLCDADHRYFDKMRLLLANHLQYTYQRGELRWPKTRLEIKKSHNFVVRENFPHAEDII